MTQTTWKFRSDRIYHYHNGLRICGKCADERTWPDVFADRFVTPLLATQTSACDYCQLPERLPLCVAGINDVEVPTG